MKRKKQLIPILLEFSHVNAGDDVYVRTHASWNDCSIVLYQEDRHLQDGNCRKDISQIKQK